MTPSKSANGSAVSRVRYVLAPCSLGWLLVAATDRGVCFTSLGDSPELLEKRLAGRFPEAAPSDDRKLSGWLTQLLELIESPGDACDLPLDIIRGTNFQRQVWEALLAIPPGTTSTYGEVARKIGRPRAVRAVGLACGANPVAPIVPCHRVLRSDGSLGGYGLGLERKRLLLERENSPSRRLPPR